MTAPAPGPFTWHEAGRHGSHGDKNTYVRDKDGRNIAAVWGKRGEKEYTTALLVAAPDLLDNLKALADDVKNGWNDPHTLRHAFEAIEAAERPIQLAPPTRPRR